MSSLVHYLQAMKAPSTSGAFHVTRYEQHDKSYEDQGVYVARTESLVRFSDGALICCIEEEDQAASDALCAECWLTYQVLEHPQIPITPATKHFTNRCQLAFWLKVQSAHLS